LCKDVCVPSLPLSQEDLHWAFTDAGRQALDTQTFDAEGHLLGTCPDVLLPEGNVQVFSQRSAASVQEAAWQSHAERFFSTKLGLARPQTRAEGLARARDAAWLQLASDGLSGCALLFARERTPSDLDRARAAQARANVFGLAELAARCPYVWIIGSPQPKLTLLASAIVASVELGPILSAGVPPTIMGVRSAREMLTLQA
jgi:hypothetical protein